MVVESHEDLTKKDCAFVDRYFQDNVYPVLTPMAVDSSRPFPLIRNKSLNLGALVSRKEVKTQWGYLAFAYRYGVFALFLLCLYVLSVLWTGAPGFWKDRKKLWIFFTALIYAVFQAVSSADLPLAHPLWLCVFLGTGYWFADEKN